MAWAQMALPSFHSVSSKDNNRPLITITATDGSNAVSNNFITNDATLTLTFIANESVTGFAVGDVGVVGGSLSSFSGSGTTYTATFTPSSNRNTMIYVPASGFTDAATNNNYASIPFYWTYDGTVPTYISGTYITGDNSKVKIRLSEYVYDTYGGSGALEVGDFTLSISGGAATLASTNPTAITKDAPTFSSSANIDNNLQGAFGVIIKDLDFDGDMDIIATGVDGDDVNWYENDGSENFTERSIDGSLDGALGLVVNDMDGDGDMDIFATAFAGDDVVWYENNGSQSFTKTVIDANLTAAYGLDVQDLDSDGDMDVVAAGRTINDVVWYENDGAGSFTEKTIDADLDGAARLTVRDLDEDGDMDVIVTALDANDVVWYANDGSESFTKSIIDDDLENARHVVVHDLDDDGDLDVIATSSDASGDDLVWYANDGSENFTAIPIANDISGAFDLEVADLDGDNDQDVIVTVFTDNDVLWYANNGSESFTKNTIDNNFSGVGEVAVEDLDGDGDLDVVATARQGDDVKFYANSDSGYVLDIPLSGTPDGTQTLTIAPTSTSIYDFAGNIASTSQSHSTVTLNDQRPTIAITAVNGSSSAVSDGSTTNDATLTVTFTSSASTSNFVVGDITVSGGSLSSFSGSGTTYTATFTPSADGATTIDVAAGTFTDASGYSNAAATQYNWTYDSVGPLITITASDGSNAVANNSTTNDATLTVTFTANESVTGFAVGDVGVVGGSLSSFSGSGTTYTATFTPSSDRNTMIYVPASGFTDAATNNNLASIPFYWTKDGTAPVYISGTYITGNNGKVKVRLSETVYDTDGGTGALETGDFTLSISGGSAALGSTNPTAITKDTPTFSAATIDNNLGSAQGLQLADLDFDGDMDIIATGYSGNDLNWYESDGSGSYTERSIDLDLNGAQGLAVNDIDGDGDLDIFATARDGDQVALYTNNGSQSFTKTVIDSDLIQPHAVECTDLNDDGYMDIIATGRTSDKIIWYSNDGSQNFTENTLNDDLDGAVTFFISDVDEDGDKDIIVAELDAGEVAYLSNNGSESFTKTTIASVNRVRAVFATDVDGDGDIDLLATGDNSSGNEVIWYSNDGSENFTANAIESSIGSANHLQVVDIDGDNDKDVIVTSWRDDDVLWYQNDGSQNFTKSYIDNDLDGSAYVKVADMDGDGDLDIVATAQNDNDVMVYTNSDSGYVLDVSLSGTPDGTQTLTILPIGTSIYDAVGNVASTSQSNSTVTLNDLRPTMAITAVNGSSSAVSDGSTTNDATLTVTFTSSAATTNFIVGDVTVSGGTLSSFSGSGTTYTATFTPTADGATTIDVAAGAFTDASGYSNAAATQYNWTYDSTAPTITGNSLASNNSTISVTFSEAVYNTSGGSGSLEASDFVLTSSSGGIGGATLASSTPSSISVSSNTYTLGISLSGTANGSETLTVNPVDDSIYDVAGNEASTSQSNNTVSLNAVNYVIDFDNDNDHVYIANSSDFESDNFTVQAWINLDAFANDDYFVYRHKTWFIGFSRSGTNIEGGVRDDDGHWLYPISTTTPSAGGGWYHVVLTFDGTGSSTEYARLYINGSLEDTESESNHDLNSQTTKVGIGVKINGSSISNYFDGQVDDVAFWNEVLTASEVSALYNSGTPLDAGSNSGNYTSSSGLVAYYKFQQNANTETGSHNGVASGSPSYSQISIP
ncbi:MAG: beta strand repeat-containing protein [Candidatus Neomarinimicrobiota bacterium]